MRMGVRILICVSCSRFWSVGHIQTNLVIQHLLCMFFYHNYESLSVHFRQPSYNV